MILKETIYLVHTYGKVASKAITKALKENIDEKVFHTHYLNPITLDRAEKYFGKDVSRNMPAIKDGEYISDLIHNEKHSYKWKIICLTREPVSWQLSMLFELNKYFLPKVFEEESFNEAEFKKTAISCLQQDPASPFLNIEFYNNWWQREINEVFNINVFLKPFPKDKGYEIYEKDNVEILIIKYEKLSEVFEKAMNDFGVKGVFLHEVNRTEDKFLGKQSYNYILNSFKVSPALFDQLYTMKSVQYFYTALEAENFRRKWQMSTQRKTYSQNYEDVLLNRIFKGKTDGFYIDVGAHDPDALSVTKLFYEKGWNGINIEPVPNSYERLKNARPRDININMAVAKEKGEMLFYAIESEDDSYWSAFSSFDKKNVVEVCKANNLNYKEIKVETDSLKAICNTYCKEKHIDFLKIDTEGQEKEIILSADFESVRPTVLVIEATIPCTNPLDTDYLSDEQPWNDFEHIILGANYDFMYFDGLNRYYLAKEKSELKYLFEVPVGMFDGIEYGKLEEQVEHLNIQLDEYKEKENNLLKKIDEYKKIESDLKEELDKYKKHESNLKEQLQIYKEKENNLSREVAALRQRETHLIEEIHTYKDKIMKHDDLVKRLYDAEKRNRDLIIAMHAWNEKLNYGIRSIFMPKITMPPIPEYNEDKQIKDMRQSDNQHDINLKISVITPSYNSGDYIERAIHSVLKQDYKNWEHIIVDGLSTDNTLEIIKKYPHINWISEKDRGQVHAMNKGFDMATGDVIVYLNADDYFEEGAFSAVIKEFSSDTMMVVGKVKVYQENENNWWINDPKIDFHSVLRHWEPDAFCVNPVGYFFRKEVQQKVPYREENGAKHDLAFLMESSYYFEKQTKKINAVLGTFMYMENTQTANEQSKLGYWTPENFAFIEPLLHKQPEKFIEEYRKEQKKGYEERERQTIDKLSSLGLWWFPSTDEDIKVDGYLNINKYLLKKDDKVIVVLTCGKVGSSTIVKSIKENIDGSKTPIYHLHFMEDGAPKEQVPHMISGYELFKVFNRAKTELKWRFIVGIREPISTSISNYYENYFAKGFLDITNNDMKKLFYSGVNWNQEYNDRVYKNVIGIDLYQYPFDKVKGYSIVNKDNISVLIYRLDKLNDIFEEAMFEFLGVSDLNLINDNITSEKKITYNNISIDEAYKNTLKTLKLPKYELEKIYSHKSTTHFFTTEEILSFIERWKEE